MAYSCPKILFFLFVVIFVGQLFFLLQLIYLNGTTNFKKGELKQNELQNIAQKVKSPSFFFRSSSNKLDSPSTPPNQLPPVLDKNLERKRLSEIRNPFERQQNIKSAMKFVWENYMEHSYGADEHRPVSGTADELVWGGMSCHLIDSLDTLWIMGFKKEFQQAKEYLKEKFTMNFVRKDISIFETTIRVIGGFLSSYELSGDNFFLEKAKEVADVIAQAFDENRGHFYTYFNPYTKEKSFPSWTGGRAILADAGTLQLELRYLSKVSKDPRYQKMGDAFYDKLHTISSFNNSGLYPVFFSSPGSSRSSDSWISFGALGDSFYEYLLKNWIHSGRKDTWLRSMYDKAIDGMEQFMVQVSESDDATYVGDAHIGFNQIYRVSKAMDHLSCFVPGMLALGTLHNPDIERNQRHLALAKKLMETCYKMYESQPSGLAPDSVAFPGFHAITTSFRLRPETVESLFYLYRITGEEKYREYGWEIFTAIETNCRTPHGYSVIVDVTKTKLVHEDRMETFYSAETLKYLYLLFGDKTEISLEDYVFNTEAHPFGINKTHF